MGLWRRCRKTWGFGVDAEKRGALASMSKNVGHWRRCRKTGDFRDGETLGFSLNCFR